MSIETALRRIASAPRFYELRIEGQHLFLGASSLESGLVGLGRLHLCQGASGLGADVGVVQLQKELALAHVVALLHQQALYGRRDGSVRFEVLQGLNLAVGGDQAANRTALDGGGTYFERSLVKIGI